MAAASLAEEGRLQGSYDKDYGGSDPTNCHVWYGGSPCCHEQRAQKPASAWYSENGWIFDRDVFVRVANGQINSWDPLPASTFHLSSLGMPNVDELPYTYAWGGAYFDVDSRQLFLSQAEMDYPEPHSPNPIVHVFEIKEG
jgi:hypothetical protein